MTSASSRTLFAALIAISSFAIGGIAKANPTPAPTPEASTPAAVPACDQMFILNYLTLAQLVKGTADYAQAQQKPPALAETAFACHRMFTTFPDMVCSVPNAPEHPRTEDFKTPCTAITALFLQHGGSLLPKQIDNSTAFGLMKAEKIQISVRQPQQFQSLINQPLMNFAVNGQVLGLQQAINSQVSVRCGVDRNASSLLFPLAFTGQSFNGVFLYEAFTAGIRAAHLVIANGSLNLVCTKESAGHITLGDIRAAFGPILSIDYTP